MSTQKVSSVAGAPILIRTCKDVENELPLHLTITIREVKISRKALVSSNNGLFPTRATTLGSRQLRRFARLSFTCLLPPEKNAAGRRVAGQSIDIGGEDPVFHSRKAHRRESTTHFPAHGIIILTTIHVEVSSDSKGGTVHIFPDHVEDAPNSSSFRGPK